MKITQANYFSEVYPKLDFAKLHPVFKEGHELISDITENGQNWNTYKSIKEVETEVDAYFRNLNALQEKGQLPMKGSAKKKGSAKGKAVIAKATKAKAAKASRTTATKKAVAKRAASKPKVEPVKAVSKPAPKAKATAKAKPAPKAKAMAKPKIVKAKAPAKPKATPADKDKATLTKLKAELTTVKAQVVSNAKFKAKVGEELTKYLKANNLDKQVGLSGITDEIKKTKAQLKFYKGLLAGDKADFKSIGKRVGIIYQVKPVKRK